MQSRPRISAAVWVIVRDTHVAEDIFQNVALKAITKTVHFESEGALLSWAFITARREGIDWLRRRKGEGAFLGNEALGLLEADWLSEATVPRDSRVEALRECMERMPEQSRQLLKLRYFEGQSCGDVARGLEAGINTVYKRLSRIHQSLRDCVETRLGTAGETVS